MDDTPPPLPPVDPSHMQVDAGTITPEMLASLLVEGDDELAAWALRQALQESSRAQVFDGLLADAMALIGRRWETGQWGISEEHLASQALLRSLDRIRPDAGPEGRVGPLAVLAAVAGERHMIGLVCLAQVLEERGWTVANLGADLPASDLARYVARNEAVLVALGASAAAQLESVVASVEAVRAARPGLPVLLGGALASRPGIAGTLGVTWAGTSLAEAARVADAIVARGGAA